MTRALVLALAFATACGHVHGDGGGGGGGGDDGSNPAPDANPGSFSVSPPMLDFGEISAAMPQLVRTLTIVNTTPGRATFDVAFTGDDAASFSVAANSCQPVASGGTCTIDIALASSHTGAYAATAVLTADAISLTAPLAAQGIAAQLTISPGIDDFGDVGLAVTATRQYTLTNAGQVALPSPTAAAPAGSVFTVVPGTCPAMLAPGASCGFSVRFKPTAPGAQAATVTGTAGPLTARAQLNGRGTAQLSAIKLGSGGGAITGAGLSCGATCTATVATATVAISAAAVVGSGFGGWGGAGAGCSTSPTCNVPIGAATVSISATFSDLPTLFVTAVNFNTQGSVSVDIPNTTCFDDCSYDYPGATTVTLRVNASPSTCTKFVGWAGACSGSGSTCTITVAADTSAVANFDRIDNCNDS